MRTVLPASGQLKHTHSELSSPLLVKTSKVCFGLLGALRSSMRAFSCLPSVLSESLQEGFRTFGRKMKGFLHPEAVVLAPESRTSSPVRIPRDPDTLQHPDLRFMFPTGEGGGYAGGILSAAMDGRRVARAVGESLVKSFDAS